MILCLTDYAAVSEIIDAISDVIEGRTVVALSTGSPEEARAAARQADKAGAAREVVPHSFPRGPADLTEHAPVLEQLTELRRGQRLGDGDLDRIHALVQQRIGLGRGHEGLTSILDCGLGGRITQKAADQEVWNSVPGQPTVWAVRAKVCACP